METTVTGARMPGHPGFLSVTKTDHHGAPALRVQIDDDEPLVISGATALLQLATVFADLADEAIDAAEKVAA
jgi:hypothetical protein